jgi:hypothetical protein
MRLKQINFAREESPKMFKRILLVALVAAGGLFASTPSADAAVVIGRVAPVRRVAARGVFPPYPVARHAVVGPIYRPYIYPGAYPVYRPMIYATPGPMIYAPGVSVWAY